ncbi:MAG: hypothetical protein ASARMPREDX12_007276 [Alectoria sarmentosa]|nr:MAG: hypothetical protein ASARMPREDX12_007276 [Alectoria sarmentosa]
MTNHKKPLNVKLPPSLPPINPSSQRRKTSTHEFSQPRQKSTDENLVDNDDLADHDKRRKDAFPYQDRPGEAPTHGEAAQDGPATTAETDTNDHVTQQGPDRKSIQQKQTADTYMECLQTATVTSFVINVVTGVSCQGTSGNGVEQLQNISYAEDISGANRFAPPVPWLSTRTMAIGSLENQRIRL